ncbi:cathepsin d [Plakobranchus ocellatus]|uniref:Cathepsin d n=1 Tax=Plakobranchus ocellatus TaxID=259542 RepID=A0AAV4DHP0_9GAST|nr:cathepsin d [Plakobranchus ocellatus]
MGLWLTRGLKSVGIVCVVKVLTGLVLDSHVMSRNYHICAKTGQNKRKESPEAYALWLESHNKSGKRSKMFTGKSGMMEVEAAVGLWYRSVDKFRLKDTTFVGVCLRDTAIWSFHTNCDGGML